MENTEKNNEARRKHAIKSEFMMVEKILVSILCVFSRTPTTRRHEKKDEIDISWRGGRFYTLTVSNIMISIVIVFNNSQQKHQIEIRSRNSKTNSVVTNSALIRERKLKFSVQCHISLQREISMEYFSDCIPSGVYH